MAADSTNPTTRERVFAVAAAIAEAQAALEEAIAKAKESQDVGFHDLHRFQSEIGYALDGIHDDLRGIAARPINDYGLDQIAADARDLVDLVELAEKPGRSPILVGGRGDDDC